MGRESAFLTNYHVMPSKSLRLLQFLLLNPVLGFWFYSTSRLLIDFDKTKSLGLRFKNFGYKNPPIWHQPAEDNSRHCVRLHRWRGLLKVNCMLSSMHTSDLALILPKYKLPPMLIAQPLSEHLLGISLMIIIPLATSRRVRNGRKLEILSS